MYIGIFLFHKVSVKLFYLKRNFSKIWKVNQNRNKQFNIKCKCGAKKCFWVKQNPIALDVTSFTLGWHAIENLQDSFHICVSLILKTFHFLIGNG